MAARDKKSDGFFTELGTFLGTWGLGIVIVMFKVGNPYNLFLLTSILLILAMLAGCIACFSGAMAKRIDASHIFIIALSGFLCSTTQIDKQAHLVIVSAALILLHLRNRALRRDAPPGTRPAHGAALYSPLGCSILFPVLLADDPGDVSMFVFSAVVLYITFRIGVHEQKLALSIYPIGAVIGLGLRFAAPVAPLSAVVALMSIAVVYYLRLQRKPLESQFFERRLWLDEVTVVLALSLFLRAGFDMPALTRYLLIASAFVVLSMLYSMVGAAYRQKLLSEASGALAAAKEKMRLDLRRNAALGAASIALWLAIQNYDVDFKSYSTHLLKLAAFAAMSVALFHRGRRLASFLLADLSKFIGVYAVFETYDYIGSTAFQSAPGGVTLAAAALQYAVVAFLIYTATIDLNMVRQGAWQGILDPRSLVHLRRSRTKAFDFLSKTPVVGWMIHFSDKVAASLHASFGKKKTWTISHYTILMAAALGLVSTHYFLKNLVGYMMPEATTLFFGTARSGPLVDVVINVVSIVLYTSIVYFSGAALHITYLRMLALIMAAINLLVFMFSDAGAQKTGATPLFYIAVFFSVMGIFAMLYRQPKTAP